MDNQQPWNFWRNAVLEICGCIHLPSSRYKEREKPLKGFNFRRRSNTPINGGVNETWSEQVPVVPPTFNHPLAALRVLRKAFPGKQVVVI